MLQLTKLLSKDNSLVLAILSTICIAVLSLISEVPQPGGLTINDKIGHSLAYLFLAFFWLIFAGYFKRNTFNLLLVALACIIYGIIIEFMQQALTATRTASVLDVIANTIGVVTAYVLVHVVKISVKK